jgi:Flp pilus assembly protein TadD
MSPWIRSSTRLVSACAVAFVGLAHRPALAADTPAPEPAKPAAAATTDPLSEARGLIKVGRWAAAIEALQRLNATASADWNNLMGYAMRKQPQPDLAAAQRHYDAALKINPRHTGALEYSGELALMKGDLATAEARLATLAQVCSTPCEPLDDLKKAVARYKASGKS